MKLPVLFTAMAALCLAGCQSQQAPSQGPAATSQAAPVPPAGATSAPGSSASFVGTWEKTNLVRVFRADGTGEQTGGELGELKFKWALSGTNLRMDFEGAAAAASGSNKVTMAPDGQSWSTEVAGLNSVWKRKK